MKSILLYLLTAASLCAATGDMIVNREYATGQKYRQWPLTFSSLPGASTALATKQDTLVNTGNIKSINGVSLLGAGDITLASGGGSVTGPILPLTMARIMATSNSTYDPYRITGMACGDSYGVDLTEALGSYVAPNRGSGMGSTYTYVGAGAYSTTDYSYSPTGITFPLTASGHSLLFPITVAKPTHKTNIFYNTIASTPGAFRVEVNVEGAGWNEIRQYPWTTNTTDGVINTYVGPNYQSHGLSSGDRVKLSTSGALPTGFSSATTYYVKFVDQWRFTISLTDGGSDVIPTNTGSGTQTAIGGPGTSVSPIITNIGSGTGAGVFSFEFGSSKKRQLRAVWVSGSIKVLGITVSDIYTGSSVKGGSEFFNLAFSGQSVDHVVACPQAVFNTILQTLKPDFATFKADDNAAAYTSSLQAYIDKCNTAWPMDWILVSSHPAASNGASTANTLTAADVVLKNIATTNGYTFIDNRALFPSYATMVAKNLINGDGYHLSPEGNYLLASYVMQTVRAVLRPQRELIKWSGRSGGVEYGPEYWLGKLQIMDDYQTDSEFFKVVQSYGVGSIPSPVFSMQRNIDKSVQFNIGNNAIGRMGWDQYDQLQITGGNNGWGYSNPPGKAARNGNGTVEVFSDDWTNSPTLNLSVTTSHASDVLRITKDATQATPGTRAAGISKAGLADFSGLALPPVGVSNLPSTPLANTFATVNNASAFTAGSTVAAGGSVKCLVQYDGAYWKMVLQLY